MEPSGAFLVLHKQGDVQYAFTTLDKTKAIDYAGEKHGTWHVQYIEVEYEVDDTPVV